MEKEIKTSTFVKPNDKASIDLIGFIWTLWLSKVKILKTVVVFIFIGVFIVIFSEDEYTASTTIVPQSSTKNRTGNLSNLAALAGYDIGDLGNETGIAPKLYPQITNNVYFKKELLETPITIKGQNKKITYKEYYLNVYKPSILGRLKRFVLVIPKLFTSKEKIKLERIEDSLIKITSNEKDLFEQLSDQLSMNINEKEGYVTLSAKMPEAIAAAEFVKRARVLLEKYVINFKIEKSTSQLKFIKKRYLEKELDFLEIQGRLSTYSDQNQNIYSARGKMELLKLQSEYDLSFSLYSELAKQLESQQIKVKEDTPIFTVLEPVFVPIKKSNSKKILIISIWAFLGFIFRVVILLVKEPILMVLKEINLKNED